MTGKWLSIICVYICIFFVFGILDRLYCICSGNYSKLTKINDVSFIILLSIYIKSLI